MLNHKPALGQPDANVFAREPIRSRRLYLGLMPAVMMLGLASRRFDEMLPGALHKNTGDVLWATLVFLMLGFLWPKWTTRRTALVAALFSGCVELSKFSHAGWLEVIRNTVVGRLVFGYVFSWSNLLCYAIGIAAGILLERGCFALAKRKG